MLRSLVGSEMCIRDRYMVNNNCVSDKVGVGWWKLPTSLPSPPHRANHSSLVVPYYPTNLIHKSFEEAVVVLTPLLVSASHALCGDEGGRIGYEVVKMFERECGMCGMYVNTQSIHDTHTAAQLL
eukprot:TRINITY_DN57812_c0_g1_i1.p1 TRINITY_DN57812_c0_g1~~TRINITY_DN57812_c0_g1_i1.p1  ORF type:complete len:125 (+),score=22.33 TRINITY_DN57812_c0_g1_i1:96-470(+)